MMLRVSSIEADLPCLGRNFTGSISGGLAEARRGVVSIKIFLGVYRTKSRLSLAYKGKERLERVEGRSVMKR